MSFVYRVYLSALELFACVRVRKAPNQEVELKNCVPSWLTEDYLKATSESFRNALANDTATR